MSKFKRFKSHKCDEPCKHFRDVITLIISLGVLPVLCAVVVARVLGKFGNITTSILALLVIAGYLWLIDVMSEDD